jgi:hypothetical protein
VRINYSSSESAAYVVVDNKRGPTFGIICAGPVFRSDGILEYLGWGELLGTRKHILGTDKHILCRVTWP